MLPIIGSGANKHNITTSPCCYPPLVFDTWQQQNDQRWNRQTGLLAITQMKTNLEFDSENPSREGAREPSPNMFYKKNIQTNG